MTEQPEPRSLQLAHDIIQAEHEHGIHPAALVIERAIEHRVAKALAEREAAIVAWLRTEPIRDDGGWITEFDVADEIEDGEHLPKGGEHE